MKRLASFQRRLSRSPRSPEVKALVRDVWGSNQQWHSSAIAARWGGGEEPGAGRQRRRHETPRLGICFDGTDPLLSETQKLQVIENLGQLKSRFGEHMGASHHGPSLPPEMTPQLVHVWEKTRWSEKLQGGAHHLG